MIQIPLRLQHRLFRLLLRMNISSIHPPISSEQELFPAFCLSVVKSSVMLTLDKELIGNAAIDAERLTAAANEQFDVYITRYCHPISFFPFYPNLSTYLVMSQYG